MLLLLSWLCVAQRWLWLWRLLGEKRTFCVCVCVRGGGVGLQLCGPIHHSEIPMHGRKYYIRRLAS